MNSFKIKVYQYEEFQDKYKIFNRALKLKPIFIKTKVFTNLCKN